MQYYGLVVRFGLVNEVKIALDKDGLLRKSVKIRPLQKFLSIEQESQNASLVNDYVVVPTLVSVESDNVLCQQQSDLPCECVAIPAILKLYLGKTVQDDQETYVVVINSKNAVNDGHGQLSDLERALSMAILATKPIDPELHERLSQLRIKEFPKQFSIYPPLIVLPAQGNSQGHSWQDLLTILGSSAAAETARYTFFSTFASALRATHVAKDAPIPSRLIKHAEDEQDNVLRSPTNLVPLYGDFGPALPAFPEVIPTEGDFCRALWVTCKQNGIAQSWAPRYSMFSSGNITEKARILHLPSVRDAVTRGRESGQGCAAVDLFAGIGYFTFSYAKAGVDRVLCWDLNPWSVEGLRRGAVLNKWTVSILAGPHCSSSSSSSGSSSSSSVTDDRSDGARLCNDARILVFCESNEHALRRLSYLRARLPPIRHVNAGMLPSAAMAWRTALRALDARLGGWLHLHETVRESEIERRAVEIVGALQEHLDSLLHKEICLKGSRVRLEHIEKVKSVAPKTIHVVVDIWVPGWEYR